VPGMANIMPIPSMPRANISAVVLVAIIGYSRLSIPYKGFST
jgi:hypothetical protein